LASHSETPNIVDPASSQVAGVSVARIAWHGWPDCFSMRNGLVEAIIVPAIGRVMQFHLLGDSAGPFWGNPSLDGQLHPSHSEQAQSDEWINFGGDKCWPAPQASWTQQQGRYWPPPLAFDAQPMEATASDYSVVLTSSVDPAFGIQVLRTVSLDSGQPVMRIRSEFRKLAGQPVKVGIWTITQMKDPERISAFLPEQSKFPNGYISLMGREPKGLEIEAGVLSLVRHPDEFVKIGTDGLSLVWEGPSSSVRIDAEQGPGEYPDGGCTTQIYTNPDPIPYVELETIGPLTTLAIGDRIHRTAVYTVSPI
jgi:hypothetical protein